MTHFGRAFEEALTWIHKEYKSDGRATIFHTKTAGKFVGKNRFIPLKSLPDYLGVIGPFGKVIAFDAKTTANLNKWKLDGRYTHQYERLLDLSKFGAISFFLVEAREINKLFALRVLENFEVQDQRPTLFFDLEDTYTPAELITIETEYGKLPDYLSSLRPWMPDFLRD
jgi:recombination protein U